MKLTGGVKSSSAQSGWPTHFNYAAKTNNVKNDRPKLGSGKRFDQLSEKLSKQPGVSNPDAVAASIGRKKYGKQRFQKLAAQGK